MSTRAALASPHYLPGKDAPLDATIERLQSRLVQLGFAVEERSWLNPVDDVWSVHLRDRDCPLLFTNGKGASELAARASALGEFFERLSCNYFWSHYYLGEANAEAAFVHYPRERWFPLAAAAPKSGKAGKGGKRSKPAAAWPAGLLTPELHAFYNPDGTIAADTLVDLNSGHAARGICALPYVRQRDQQTVWFPVNIIGNLYVSNGMSAGNTPAEARTQALAEIFERHVKNRVISEGLCLPEVPEAVIARYPHIAAGIAGLRAAGFGILVKDASLGGQYPVMNVTLLHPQDQGCFASFGAHPRFEIALERALTELLQGRALDALAGFPEPGFDLDEIASSPNIEIHFVDSSGIISWNFLADTPDHDFVDWNFSQTTAEDYAWLLGRLHGEGHDVYIADFEHLGVYACRILVPGVSEIYGIDDLEWENSSVGNRVRAAILQLPRLDTAASAALLAQLHDLDLDEQRPVAALIGLAADPGSFWADLRVGELKTLLALVAEDEDAIREGCDWLAHFADLDTGRRKIYRCVATLLELEDREPYRHPMTLLYGAATLAQAEALLRGELDGLGLTAPGLTLDGCDMHQRLLQAYAKVRQPQQPEQPQGFASA